MEEGDIDEDNPDSDFQNEDDDVPDICSASEDVADPDSWTLLDSMSFSMTGEMDTTSSATIVLQKIEEHRDKLNLLCNFTTNSDSLLTDDTCPPEIYLVSGHSTCHVSDLPATVSAKKLAEIHTEGYGQTLVDLTWDDVSSSCVLIVRY